MAIETEDAQQIGWFARRISLAKAGLALFGAIATMTAGALAYGTSFAKKDDVAGLSEKIDATRNVAAHADAVSTENERVQKIMIDAMNRIEGKVDGLHDKFDDVIKERRRDR